MMGHIHRGNDGVKLRKKQRRMLFLCSVRKDAARGLGEGEVENLTALEVGKMKSNLQTRVIKSYFLSENQSFSSIFDKIKSCWTRS